MKFNCPEELVRTIAKTLDIEEVDIRCGRWEFFYGDDDQPHYKAVAETWDGKIFTTPDNRVTVLTT